MGTFLTVTLAVIFTAFQWVEYHQTSFTLSDGVFGSTFFFATGFHGLPQRAVALNNYVINFKPNIFTNSSISNGLQSSCFFSTHNGALPLPLPSVQVQEEQLLPKVPLLITLPTPEPKFYSLNSEFIEWFVGFADGEGNFNIRLTNLSDGGGV